MHKTSFFRSLRTKLLLLVLFLVIPAFGLVIYANFEQRRVEKDRVRENIISVSQLTAANEENFIKNARQLLATLTQFPFLLLSSDHSVSQYHFANLLKLSPDYLNFGLIETNGVVFCNALSTNGSVNLGDRAYFKRAMQTRAFSIGDFQIGRLTEQPALNFGYPVLDEGGHLKRVLYASLKLSKLSEAARQVRLPSGGSVIITDRTGNVIARFPEPEKWIGKSLTNTPFIQKLATAKDGVFEAEGPDGISRLYAVTMIKDKLEPGLFVSVGVPLDSSYAHANLVLLRNSIVLGLVAALVLIGAQIYIQYFFARPVNTLARVAEQLAEGNLNSRTGTIKGPTELVRFGQTFDTMAARLQKRHEEIQEAQREITELNETLERRVRDRTAQLEEANKEMESFSYSVSHDLRAPLRHIDGFVEMLQKDSGEKLDATGSRYLQIISESAKRMGVLIDDLLAFSRMNHQLLRKSNIDLQQLVDEVIGTVEQDAVGRKIVWKRGPLPQVDADSAMLRQLVMNLLSNAVKYSRTREVATIEIRLTKETPKEFVIAIRDNGVGFDMRYADKLFGIFQRLHSAEEFEGTGIGLANVRRIILRHGGRVWAESELGCGATFYFSLPRMT